MIKAVLNFFNKEGLLKDSSVLMAGMAGTHVLNLLFQIVMGRTLVDGEYALLVSLLGMLNIFTIPLGVIASTMNRYTSLLIHDNRKGDIRRLVLFWGGRVVFIGVLLSLVCFLLPGRIAQFFNLERSAPIYIFGIIMTAMFCRPIFGGTLLGLQSFGFWSFNSLLGWGIRLVVGTLLVLYVSAFAGWGLLGHGIGLYVTTGTGMLFVFVHLRGHPTTDRPLPKMQGYMWGSFFVLLGYSIMMMADVVLVKHLCPEDAGDFSYAATLGRFVIFIPQAFVAAMFPKVVSEKNGTKAQRALYLKTLLLTLLTTVCSAVAFLFLVKPMLWLLWNIKDPSPNLVLWSCMLAWVMIPVALLGVAVQLALAQKLFKVAIMVPVCGAAYLTWCLVGGLGVVAILTTLAVLSSLSLGGVLIGTLLQRTTA